MAGQPWGVVNYHPDKCSAEAEHWHVVWQQGDALRRSAVTTTPRFEEFWPDEGDRFVSSCVHDLITLGETPYFDGNPPLDRLLGTGTRITTHADFPAFRSWQAMQKRTNNSLVALVIGTRLAEMKMSEAKGFGKVGQVLAGVAHAERLDVSADAAELIFQTASTDIAFLAIPQVVALHIELCVETVEECLRHPGLVTPPSNGAPPDRWMLPDLAKAVRFGESPTTADQLMKFCVALRNSIMHGAGKVDRKLILAWTNLDKAAKKRWSIPKPRCTSRTDNRTTPARTDRCL